MGSSKPNCLLFFLAALLLISHSRSYFFSLFFLLLLSPYSISVFCPSLASSFFCPSLWFPPLLHPLQPTLEELCFIGERSEPVILLWVFRTWQHVCFMVIARMWTEQLSRDHFGFCLLYWYRVIKQWAPLIVLSGTASCQTLLHITVGKQARKLNAQQD